MRTLPLAVLFTGLCFQNTAYSQSPPGSYHGPVHVELLKYLQVRHVHPGSPVFVRVTEKWNALGCELRQGAIVEGKVEVASPRAQGNKKSQLALSFRNAQCRGMEMAPINLVLAAVSWIPDTKNVVPVIRVADLHNGGVKSSIDFIETAQQAPRPKLQPGQVYGIRGLKLEIGAGPERSSLLSATNRDVSLDRQTEFLLVPSSVAFLPTPVSLSSDSFAAEIAASESSAPLSPGSLAPAASDEFQPCSPPFCSTDLSSADTETSGHPAKSIAMQPLGYSPRPRKEIEKLDNDQEVAWLGPNRVLIAFNPHKLIHRDGSEAAASPIRSIHAVLVDVDGERILGSADWSLSDEGKFLWRLSGNRLLIHAGNELRIYDAQLTPVSRLPLDGPLAFVRISPSGEFISIGTIRERHTRELHEQLRDSLDRDPEEDVSIVALDKDFKTIAHAETASDIMPPALLDEGQIRLLAQPGNRYRLALTTWENQTLTLARFSSSCIPEISTFAPDLVFVRTCDKATKSIEIRVLHPDGQLVMRGKPDPQELGHGADGNSESQNFAVRTMRAASAVHPGSPFHGADLVAQEIRVCRATDGKRLASVRADSPAPSEGGFALSPNGSRLAVITDAHLNIYPVPIN